MSAFWASTCDRVPTMCHEEGILYEHQTHDSSKTQDPGMLDGNPEKDMVE